MGSQLGVGLWDVVCGSHGCCFGVASFGFASGGTGCVRCVSFVLFSMCIARRSVCSVETGLLAACIRRG